MRKLTLLAVAGAVLAANAAVVRKMPDMTVVEGEMVATDSMKATAVRSSNAAVFSAALRESGEAIVSGTRLGEAELSYVDERGVFASRPVMVVPSIGQALTELFQIAVLKNALHLKGTQFIGMASMVLQQVVAL